MSRNCFRIFSALAWAFQANRSGGILRMAPLFAAKPGDLHQDAEKTHE
ncbi:MAG: hypothetical protein LC641_06925 [Spirochaeta sp.]|nr:hypothetical protein [Spirochaeta sp.]